MATYTQIESLLRKQNNHYVSYEFSKLFPKLADSFDYANNVCRYPIVNEDTDVKKEDIEAHIISKLKVYSGTSSAPTFHEIKELIHTARDNGTLVESDGYTARVIEEYLRKYTAIGKLSSDDCNYAMASACAYIDFSTFAKDIEICCTDTKKMQETLNLLQPKFMQRL